MASKLYNNAKEQFLSGGLDLANDTLKVLLVTSSYTFDADEVLRSELSNEASGTGYSSGGVSLSNGTVTQDDTNDRGTFDADDVTWSVATITARAAIIYEDNGAAGSDLLIAYIDFGSDYSTNGADFVLQWSASGIFYL